MTASKEGQNVTSKKEIFIMVLKGQRRSPPVQGDGVRGGDRGAETYFSDDGHQFVGWPGILAHQLSGTGVQGGGVANHQHIPTLLLCSLQ